MHRGHFWPNESTAFAMRWLIISLNCLLLAGVVVDSRSLSEDNDVPGSTLPSAPANKGNSVIPLNYTLLIRPILDESQEDLTVNTAPGEVTVRVQAVQDENKIRFYQRGLQTNFDEIRVVNLSTGKPVGVVTATGYDSRKRSDEVFSPTPANVFEIHLEETFSNGQELEIYLPYILPLPTVPYDHGTFAFRSPIAAAEYADPVSKEIKRFALTRLTREGSRKLFPLIETINTDNEPEFRTPFKVIIGRIEGKYVSVSNMPLAYSEPDDKHPGWMWDHYQETVPITPYQLFILVSDFPNHTLNIDNQQMTTVTRTWTSNQEGHPEASADMSEVAGKLISFYENTLKTSLPSRKLDIVRIPKYYGDEGGHLGVLVVEGVKNSAEAKDTSNQRLEVIKHLASEIAQQWFGILIQSSPPSPQQETQLNPGIAKYLELKGIKQLFPDYPLEQLSKLPTSRFPEEYVGTLLHLLEDMFGAKIMESAIERFLQKWKFRVATEKDLFESIQEAFEVNNMTHLLPINRMIQEIMHDWLRFSRREYPLVRVKIKDEKTLSFSQEVYDSFRNNPFVPPEFKVPTNSTWFIPVKLVTQNASMHTLWLSKDKTENCTYSGVNEHILDTTKWILGNPEGIAAYRIIYDEKLTQLLASQLEKDHTIFPRAARFQLIDSQIFAAVNGYLPFESALDLTKYLQKENSKEIWSVVAKELVGALIQPFQEEEEAFQKLQKYFSPKMETFLEEKNLRNYEDLQKACLSLRVPACIRKAHSILEQWQLNPDADAADIFPEVPNLETSDWICAAVAHDQSGTNWNFVLSKFLKRSDPRDKDNDPENNEVTELLKGLACSRNPLLLSSVLNDTLQMSNKTREQILAVFAASNEPVARDVTYDFAKWNLLTKRISANDFSTFVSQFLLSRRAAKKIEDLQQFINSNQDLLQPVLITLNNSMEDFNRCMSCEWWMRIGMSALKWLYKQ